MGLTPELSYFLLVLLLPAEFPRSHDVQNWEHVHPSTQFNFPISQEQGLREQGRAARVQIPDLSKLWGIGCVTLQLSVP